MKNERSKKREKSFPLEVWEDLRGCLDGMSIRRADDFILSLLPLACTPFMYPRIHRLAYIDYTHVKIPVYTKRQTTYTWHLSLSRSCLRHHNIREQRIISLEIAHHFMR